VHKDQLIVYFVTFLVLALFFKLYIATASSQDFLFYDREEDDYHTNNQELNCQVLLNDHVPQVFMTLGIIVVFFKARLFGASINTNNVQFKKEHKNRSKTYSVLLKMAQVISFILIGFRFITTCNENNTHKNEE